MVLLSNLDWFIAFQINKGHPPQDEDIFLAPQLQGVIKPHQVVISIFLLKCFKLVTRTRSYKENLSLDLRYARIRACSLADKSHVIIFSQSEA